MSNSKTNSTNTSERRKEMNRLAAQKLRNRQKEKSINIRQEYFTAQSNNTRLSYEVRQLHKEKNELALKLDSHLQTYHQQSNNLYFIPMSVKNEPSEDGSNQSIGDDTKMLSDDESSDDSLRNQTTCAAIQRTKSSMSTANSQQSSIDDRTGDMDENDGEMEDGDNSQLGTPVAVSSGEQVYVIYFANPNEQIETRTAEQCLPVMVSNINEFCDS